MPKQQEVGKTLRMLCQNSKMCCVIVEIIVEDGIEGTIWHRKYNTLQCYNSLWLTTDVVATYLHYRIATCISITDIVNTKDIKCPTVMEHSRVFEIALEN